MGKDKDQNRKKEKSSEEECMPSTGSTIVDNTC